jgi:hypothetical protein
MANFKILKFPAKCPFPEKSSLDEVTHRGNISACLLSHAILTGFYSVQ